MSSICTNIVKVWIRIVYKYIDQYVHTCMREYNIKSIRTKGNTLLFQRPFFVETICMVLEQLFRFICRLPHPGPQKVSPNLCTLLD